ncbi:MAG: tetratricopeptide repeat protein [Candidatus Omnitrophota bacterium]|jgi:tetratricopeptide (TPR) repeat protein
MSKSIKFTVFILSMFLWASFSSKAAAENTATGVACCANIEESKTDYFKDNRYNEFVDFLGNFKDKKSLPAGCLDYYKALSRYAQLKYLEEKQLWDDYFSNGNTYRDQILENVKKAIAETDSSSCLRPKSRFLLWQFYHDQQNTFGEQGLDELIADVSTYAKVADDPGLIKVIADKLLASDEKPGARAIYKLYVNKLASGKISDAELKNVGLGFYKDGNLELAETVYDIYLERIYRDLPPEKLTPELFEIASLFVYKAPGLYDMPYAEKIYTKIDELGQENSFNEESIYLRAFNLEKSRDYKKAGELYSKLVQLYPDTRHFDEAVYKIAMINAYVLADVQKAREYFDKLIAKTAFSPQVISSFYQLGLLAQWEGDLAKAKGYYDVLLKSSGDKYAQVVAQANDRLEEIEENKQLSYNLKTFLDATLKKENAPVELGSSELKLSSFILKKEQKVIVSTFANMPESGCNQVQVQYLWSGNLGGANPQATDASFESSYSGTGTKEINVVIVSPAGITDLSFAMADVY